jgi:sugar O-acyltransferase (sialic acid O-acetyltransferase NeuD family)
MAVPDANMVHLIGAGGHGKVCLEILLSHGCPVVLLDGDAALTGKEVQGHRIGKEEKVLASLESPVDFFVAIGDPSSRRRVTERWEARGHRPVRLIHPSAVVSPSARIEAGAAVMAGTVIQAGAEIGKGTIVNTGATVDHDCRLGAFVHVAPGAHIAGAVQVGEGAWVGIGAAVREGVSIGARSVVGAGGVVVDDLPKDVVAFGNPCRVVRSIGSQK